jgi:hypothetical protein
LIGRHFAYGEGEGGQQHRADGGLISASAVEKLRGLRS